MIKELEAGRSSAFDRSTFYYYLAILYLLAIAGFLIQYFTERAVCVMVDDVGDERKAGQ